ncbi:bactofilin family protein [Hyphomicrobium sp.]|uniref:bactofilin family protein n=1 Tax=Hyphomicrobium sp. TaxID=82 RepID=UPI003F6FC7CE
MGNTLSIPRQAAIEGAIRFPGSVVVDGTIVGDVSCTEILITERGAVEGTVAAETVTIMGEASGAIYADHVTLKTACLVTADIFHSGLSLENGCFFEGKSRRVAQPRNLANRVTTEAAGADRLIR